MLAQNLRKKYNPRLQGLQKHSNLAGWAIVGGYVGSMIAAGALGHWLISGGLEVWSTLLVIGLMLFIATRLRGLNNIVHETSHATFVVDRAQNVLLGKICSALTMGSFMDYRDEHLTHHAHLGNYEKDHDFQGIEALALHDALTWRVVLRHLFTPLIGRHLPYYLNISRSTRDGLGFVAVKAVILCAVFVLAVAQPLTALFFVIAPFVLLYPSLNYWADCLDHAGLVDGADELDKSRNILAPRVLAWLFFPRHDGFHLVHHLFPQVPARHLERTHDLLCEDSVYSAKLNATGGLMTPAVPRPGSATAANLITADDSRS